MSLCSSVAVALDNPDGDGGDAQTQTIIGSPEQTDDTDQSGTSTTDGDSTENDSSDAGTSDDATAVSGDDGTDESDESDSIDGQADTNSEGTVDFSEHTVAGVTPSNTTINLFDYWVNSTNPLNEGNSYETLINKGHALKFLSHSNPADYAKCADAASCNIQDRGEANFWTGARSSSGGEKDLRRTGIVQNTLDESGYPKLAGNTDEHPNMFKQKYDGSTHDDFTESLQYLFDPTVSHDGKESYAAVGNLLQIDDNGYYYYDSSKNFASYDSMNRKFTLYDSGAVNGGGTTSSTNSGTQFFPFNTAEEVFDANELDKDSTLKPNGIQAGQQLTLNHYFGLTMSTRFTTQNNGKVTGYDGQEHDMEYNFAGDDDVWIYIDDVLVADLGGIHDPVGTKINFATGKITFGSMNEDGSLAEIAYSTTIYEAFKAAGKEGTVDWIKSADGTTNIFANDGNHTIKMFYLERGNQASNLRLSFNLVNIPESSIVKVDQSGNPVAGVVFQLYGADKDYSYGDKSLVAEGTTDSAGQLVLTNPQSGEPISFDEIYARGPGQNGGYEHYVLHEVKAPEGYRISGDVKLDYHQPTNGDTQQFSGYVTSNTESMWETGAYASAGVLIQAPNEIHALKNPENPNEAGASIDPYSGSLFAVVLMYQGDEPTEPSDLSEQGNWKVVVGDSLNGYTYYDADTIKQIAEVAAQHPESAHRFVMQVKGGLQATIDELPGDISTYFNLIESKYGAPSTNNMDAYKNLKYTVAYYHTKASSLKNATGDNTTRLYIAGKDANTTWQRQFSVNLKVPNIKNRLLVQKTDEKWNPLTDIDEKLTVKFTLYSADQFDVEKNKPIEPDDYYDQAITEPELLTSDAGIDTGKMLMHSAAMFPTGDKVLKEGVYYLVETGAASASELYGYKVTSQVTKVVVTSDGVYADAGKSDDDVRVWKGVGSLVRTLAEFASDDKFDNTLRDITATLQTGPEPTYDQSLGWRYTWSDSDPVQSHNLTYGSGGAVLQYGLTGVEAGRPGASFEDVSLMVDVGWSNLRITQNYSDNVSSDLKQDLVDLDLDNLFSGTTAIQIRNWPNNQNVSVPLEAVKTVAGDDWPEGATFTFKLEAGESPHSKVEVPLPVGDGVVCDSQAGSCTVTVSKPESGNTNTVSLGDLTYTLRMFSPSGVAWSTDSLTFTYTISEITPSADNAIEGMTYSKAIYTLSVTVSRLVTSGNALKADVTMTRDTADNGSASGLTVNTSTWGYGSEDADHVTPSATFTNSFGHSGLSLPLTGGTTARQWLALGLSLIGISVLAWLAYREWRRRNGLSNTIV
ncbi:Spy0128 family protein [Bifidobacterium lemurum]|nr:FctA domain-containing protein [Bifidobacterium lemurum]